MQCLKLHSTCVPTYGCHTTKIRAALGHTYYLHSLHSYSLTQMFSHVGARALREINRSSRGTKAPREERPFLARDVGSLARNRLLARSTIRQRERYSMIGPTVFIDWPIPFAFLNCCVHDYWHVFLQTCCQDRGGTPRCQSVARWSHTPTHLQTAVALVSHSRSSLIAQVITRSTPSKTHPPCCH